MGNLKLNNRTATPDDKEHVISALKWCYSRNLEFAGLPYTDDLVNINGIHLQILAPEGTDPDRCEQALRAGYRDRDIVNHSVMLCPIDWFAEARPEIQ